MLNERITIGPFGIFFTNVNRQMSIPGHSHYAKVWITFKTMPAEAGSPPVGFPAFEETYKVISDALRGLCLRPFRDATNEVVARRIFEMVESIDSPVINNWGGAYALSKLVLGVQGVLDSIGHADGMTMYEISAP